MNNKSCSFPRSVRSPRRQRGAFWGNVLVFAVLVGIAVLGIRLVPVYIDSMSIKQGLNSMLEQDLAKLKTGQIREMLLKRYDISAVQAVTSKNFNEVVTIEKKKGKVRIHVKYRAERPLVGNLSVLADFEHEVEK